jgi:hypothetical protein
MESLDRVIAMTKDNLENLETDSAELESVAVHRDVPKEEAVVKPVRGRKKRHRDRHLAKESR